LNPALRRLIETIRGERFVRRGMVSISDRNSQSSVTDLLSSFQRPIAEESRCSLRPLWLGAVEGCCLYGISFESSTSIEYFSAAPVTPYPSTRSQGEFGRSLELRFPPIPLRPRPFVTTPSGRDNWGIPEVATVANHRNLGP
jgi:hypothetical protein